MVLLMEGFDLIAPSDASKRGWDAIAGMGTGRFGTGQSVATSAPITKALKQASTNTAILQHGYKPVAQTAPVTLFWGYQGGSVQFVLTYDPSASAFKFYRGDSATGTLIAVSDVVSMTVGAWHFLELAVVMHASTGSMALNLDTVTVFTASALNTLATGTTNIDRAGFGGGASADLFDDFVVLDTSGSAPLNASIGDAAIDPHYPTADGAHHAFTPSSGTTHFDKVDESTPSAVDFVSSGLTNDIDTFAVGDVSTDSTILAVQVSMCVAKDASGARTVAPVIRQGSTDYVGTSQSPLVSQSFLTQIYETNPATSAPFTPTNFNADEFGIKVTA